jgi:hypothetical protein
VLEQLEEGWRQEVEKQVRRKSMEGERKMAVMRESLANEKGTESEVKVVEELSRRIEEFNQMQGWMLEEYTGTKVEDEVGFD